MELKKNTTTVTESTIEDMLTIEERRDFRALTKSIKFWAMRSRFDGTQESNKAYAASLQGLEGLLDKYGIAISSISGFAL
jgi:hypothetical protein